MKTEVIMKRELFGGHISQKSKSGFFSATDLVRAGNRWRKAHNKGVFNLWNWLKKDGTKEFIEELEQEHGGRVVVRGRPGKNSHTWVHPLLFIDMALAMSPKLKLTTYKWLYDNLILYRNDSGDSYTAMCGSLYVRHKNHRTFQRYISSVAKRIRIYCGVKDWQHATEEQLALRDDIHKEIAVLAKALNNNDAAVRTAFEIRDAERVGPSGQALPKPPPRTRPKPKPQPRQQPTEQELYPDIF